MQWMILPLKRYFDFRGRSRRKEFWMYTLFVIIVSIALSIVDAMLGLGGGMSGETDLSGTSVGAAGTLSGGVLASLFALATFIPTIAVSVRRLHDIDRTGWWVALPLGFYLAALVLVVGSATSDAGAGMTGVGLALMGVGVISAILLLVWYCMPGTPGPNRFGEDPKGQTTNAEEVFG